MRTRILFFISVLCAGALLLLFVLVASEQPVRAASSDCIPDNGEKKLGGRAWNSRIGWITHEFEVNVQSGDKPHCFLSLEKKEGKALPLGTVKGWSWSRFGYLCWGGTCKVYGNDDSKKAPDDNAPSVEVFKSPSEKECADQAKEQAPKNKNLRDALTAECNKTAVNKVKGWIKILALHGKTRDNGWVCLSPETLPSSGDPTGCDSKNTDGNRAVEYGVFYDPVKNEFKGKAWSPAVGWIVFSGSTIAEADDAICIGKINQTISADPMKCADPSNLDACKATLVALCKKDINNFSFNLQKRASKWKTSYVGPGIRVSGGNAYSLSGFGTGSENNISTVEYLIFTPKQKSGFQELCRESSAAGCKQFSKKIKDDESGDDDDEEDEKESKKSKELRRTKKLPTTSSEDTTPKREVQQPALKRQEPASDSETPTAILRSSVGKLDVDKLIRKNSANKNAYGNDVITLEGSGMEITDTALDDRGCNLSDGVQNCSLFNTVVVITNKDFHITNPMRFLNVSDARSKKGGVTFVVKGGNLKIDDNIYYESSQVNQLNKLASVAWIVLKKDRDITGATGNILFGDCIPQSIYDMAAQSVGMFFAENAIYTGTGKDLRGRNANGSINEGAGKTSDSCNFTSGALPFQLNGMMIGKKFTFERMYEGDGSEDISYDGRLLVSIPPGLSDVLKKMPTWSP